jgi:hypothetical protein
MDRRRLLATTAGATLAAAFSPLVRRRRAAADASGAAFATLGLPAVRVVADAAGFRVEPATTPAGWTVVTLENRRAAGDASADLMALPAGQSIDDLLTGLTDPTAPPPSWAFRATFAGAPWAAAGGAARALVQLPPGELAIFSPEPVAPALLTVTPGGEDKAPDVAVTAEVVMEEMAFAGLNDPLPAGPQIWKITNAGALPHLMALIPAPPGATDAQLVDELMAAMTAGPAPDPAAPTPPMAGGCSTLSAGRSLFLALDLAPGSYGAICFFGDAKTGAPHAMAGMVGAFTVG